MSDPGTKRVPREHPVTEEIALRLEAWGFLDEAKRTRRMGYTQNPVSVDEETAQRHLRYARFWIGFNTEREKRPRPTRIVTVKKCCVQFEIVDVNGAADLNLAERILSGRIPGVAAIKKRILDDEQFRDEEENTLAT